MEEGGTIEWKSTVSKPKSRTKTEGQLDLLRVENLRKFTTSNICQVRIPVDAQSIMEITVPSVMAKTAFMLF